MLSYSLLFRVKDTKLDVGGIYSLLFESVACPIVLWYSTLYFPGPTLLCYSLSSLKLIRLDFPIVKAIEAHLTNE